MPNIYELKHECVEAINFAISECDDEGVNFLRAWQEGDWETCEKEFNYKVSDELKNPCDHLQNTKVTIQYSNGSTREFEASDELEALINEGEMFSVSTMHSDISIEEEVQVSKMYAGNPVAALGHMMMMRRNAEGLMNSKDRKERRKMPIVIETLNACIQLLSDQVTSHQSGMTEANGESVKWMEDDDMWPPELEDGEIEGYCESDSHPCGKQVIHGKETKYTGCGDMNCESCNKFIYGD